MRRIAPALLAALLVLSACSSPASNDAGEETAAGADASEDSQADAGSGRSASEEKDRKKDEKRSKRGGTQKKAGSQPDDGDDGAGEATSDGKGDDPAASDDGAPGSGKAAGDGDRGAAPSGSGGSGSNRPDPESGRYTFAQQGWEEFCAGTCSRGDLPPTAQVDTTVSPAGEKLRVVSESRSSEERSTETTSVVSSGAVEVTRVELRYGSFSNTYDPSPPVKSIDLPLTVGDSWESSWRADTSGTYSATVVGRDSMVVDGTRIKTFKLDTAMQLRGQFRGTATTTMWVDPGTATAIRSRGKVRIQTDYGRFNSNFDMMLLEGPGY